jgi:hypothetical protein
MESKLLLFKQGSAMFKRLVFLIQTWKVWLSIFGPETDKTVRVLRIFPQSMESLFGIMTEGSRMPLIFMVDTLSDTHFLLCPLKNIL